MAPVTYFKKVAHSMLSKVLLLILSMAVSVQALSDVPIYADETTSTDGEFTIYWPSTIWNSFTSSANSGYVHVEFRPEVGSGDFTMSTIQTYTRISSYKLSNQEVGEYRLQFRACGTYSSGRSGGCVQTSKILVEVQEASAGNGGDNDLPILSFDAGLAGWANTSPKSWSIRSNGTPSSYTGPSGSVDGSNYAYMETSSGSAYTAGDKASLTSPSFTLNNSNVTFHYHMYGSNIGTLELQVVQNGVATTIWQKSGQQQSSSTSYWKFVSTSLSGFSGTAQLRFVGTAAGGYRGDMAIDKIEVLSSAPPFDVTATSVSANSVLVDWRAEAHSDCNAFVVYYENLDGDESDESWVSNCNDRSRTISNLGAGRWQFKVSQYFQRDFCIPGDDCLNEEWESSRVVGGVIAIGDGSGSNQTTGIDRTEHVATYVNEHDQTVGEIQGNFSVGASGNASYSIPLALPKGSGSATPSVSLNYSSGAGSGLLGKGWSLGGVSNITRCGQSTLIDGQDAGIKWSLADRLCLNGERLILQSGTYGSNGAVYATEMESHARVTASGGINGSSTYYTVKHNNGSTEYFGATVDARRNNVNGVTYSWAISSKEDIAGNEINYSYNNSATARTFTLATIDYAYGNTITPYYTVKFNYKRTRLDPITRHIYGSNFSTLDLLDTIEIKQGNKALISYKLGYQTTSVVSRQSRIESVQQCVGDQYSSTCYPATIFDWTEDNIDYSSRDITNADLSAITDIGGAATGDINGDGITDLLIRHNSIDSPSDANPSCAYSYFLGSAEGLIKGDYERVEGACHIWQARWHSFNSLVLRDFNFDGRSDYLGFFSDYSGSEWGLFGSDDVTVGTAFPFSPTLGNGNAEGKVEMSAYGKGPYLDLNGDGVVDEITRAYTGEPGYKNGSPTYNPSCMGGGDLNLIRRFNVRLSNIDSETGEVDWNTKYSVILPSRTVTFCVGGSNGSDTVELGYAKYGMQFGDFNGDGKVDIAVKGSDGNAVNKAYYVFELPIGVDEEEIYLNSSIDAFSAPTGNAGTLSVVDVNGDGLDDVVALESYRDDDSIEDDEEIRFSLRLTSIDTSFRLFYQSWGTQRNYSYSFMDFDGDGDLDIFTGYNVYKFEGDNYELTDVFNNLELNYSGDGGYYYSDFTGDGRIDLLFLDSYVNYEDNGSNYLHWGYYGSASLLTGAESTELPGRIKAITSGAGHVTNIYYENLAGSENYKPFDIDANGPSQIQDDLCVHKQISGACINVYNSGASNETAFYNRLAAGPLLPEVNSDSLQEHLAVKPTSGGVVVTRVEKSNPHSVYDGVYNVNQSALQTTDYYYGRAFYQSYRGYLGFETVTKVDREASLETQTVYRQDFPFAGRAAIQQVRTTSGTVISTSYTDWRMNRDGSQVIYPYQIYASETVVASNDPLNGTLLKLDISSTSLDANGMPEEQVSTITGVAGETKTVTRDNQFEQCDELRLLSYQTITHSRTVSGVTDTKINQTDFEYYQSSTDNGYRCQLEVQTLAHGTDDEVQVTYAYDAFGNATSTSKHATGLVTRTVETEYDALGRYVKKQYDAKSQLVSEVLSVNNWGSPLTAKNANGLLTTIRYDGFNHVIHQAANDGNWSASAKEWCGDVTCNTGEVVRVAATNAEGARAYQYLDTLGRVVRESVQGFDGTYVNTVTRYNAQGLPFAITLPGLGWAVTYYDGFGRQTRQVNPDTTEATTVYDGFITTQANALLQTKTETKNALGELVRIQDNDTGEVLHSYDALGNLVSATSMGTASDPHNITVLIGYDHLGRKDWMDDPDKGYWDYDYNAYGELTLLVNANNESTEHFYDLNGRLEKRIDKDVDGNIINLTQWFFDGALPAGAPSALASISNATGAVSAVIHATGDASSCSSSLTEYCEVFEYDSIGRPLRTTKALGVNAGYGTYSSSVAYDAVGRVLEEYDAFGEIMAGSGKRHHYNQYGYAFGLSDINSGAINGAENGNAGYEDIYQILSVNEAGQVTASERGNGVVSDYFYNPLTGRIETQVADAGGAFPIQHITYTWDDIGNLQTRANYSGRSVSNYTDQAVEETFCYDSLNRLTLVESGLNAGCAGTPQMVYNSVGNIMHKHDVGTYTYDQVNAGPHAVTQTTQGSTVIDYNYDSSGNLTSDGEGRNILYTVFDKPYSIQKGPHLTQFSYGPDRARWKRVDIDKDFNTTTTLYLGGVERVIKQNISGAITETTWERYLGDFALYSITTEGNTITEVERKYLYKDYQGSVGVITDENAKVITLMSFDAWGKRRNGYNAQPFETEADLIEMLDQKSQQTVLFSSVTTKGYTGHEMLDEVGLIHMNGRVYNPTLARFVSADPLIPDATDTQNYNRYSYVLNKPMFYTDPSGFRQVDACGGRDSANECAEHLEKKDKEKEEELKAESQGDATTEQSKDDGDGAVNSLEEATKAWIDNMKQFAADNPDYVGEDGAFTEEGQEAWEATRETEKFIKRAREAYSAPKESYWDAFGDKWNERVDQITGAADRAVDYWVEQDNPLMGTLASTLTEDNIKRTANGLTLAAGGAAWQVPKQVYHFTTAANASQIVSQGILRVGSNNAWGKGVYVTRWNSRIMAKLSGAASVEARVVIQTSGKGFQPSLLIPGTFRTPGTSVVVP